MGTVPSLDPLALEPTLLREVERRRLTPAKLVLRGQFHRSMAIEWQPVRRGPLVWTVIRGIDQATGRFGGAWSGACSSSQSLTYLRKT